MSQWILCLAIGLAGGIATGFSGIGGGLVVVPLLIALAGFQPHQAIAISLINRLLPVAALAAYAYYADGRINRLEIIAALLVAAGILAGGWIGAKLGLKMGEDSMRLLMGTALIIIGGWMLLKPAGH